MKFNFTTPIHDVVVRKFSEFMTHQYTIADIEVDKFECEIKWSVDIDITDKGLNGAYKNVESVTCKLFWRVEDDSLTVEETEMLLEKGGQVSGEYMEGEIEIDFDDWQIDEQFRIDMDCYCSPYEAYLDFETKTLTIS